MPFKSKSQQRFMFAAEARGELPEGTAKRWAHETKSIKKLPESVEKKAFELQGRTTFQGLNISIENKKGSKRHWYDPHGKEKGSTLMHYDYGYARGTEGTDGDHVDVYIGPNPEASHAFIVNQMKKPEGSTKGDSAKWTKFDEQKCMLGFDSAAEAKAAYLKQYDDPRFFGSLVVMPMEIFKEKVMSKENHGKKIARAKAADLLSDIGRNAVRFRGVAPATRKTVEASIRGAKPMPIPAFRTHAEQVGEGVKHVARKKTPTQAMLPMHKANPEAHIEFAKRTATPAVGSASVLDQLARSSFDKLSKKANEERVNRIANRVDDAGLALLGAPSAAWLAGAALKKAPNAKLRAAGEGIQKGVDNLHGAAGHGVEAAGLALVSPTVSHAIAKRFDKKANDDKKVAALEKLAAEVYPDYDYLTEPEKVAFLASMLRSGGAAAVRGGRKLDAAARLRQIKGKNLMPGVGTVDADIARGAAGLKATTKAPPVPTPAAPKPSPGLFSGKNVAKAGVIGTMGLGLYGGKKVLDATTALAGGQHEPLEIPTAQSPGRVF